jgi:hypothetical protein
MKIWIGLFILIMGLQSSVVFSKAKGGDLVNNGGGLAERNVLFAYTNLEFSLKLCLDSTSCHLSATEQSLLRTIYEHLAEERSNLSQIEFISEVKNPGTFIIDGEMKAAVTGSTIGTVIRINTDLLYTTKNNNQLEALSVHESVAMLIHELGHHYGDYSHVELDLLGIKVAQNLGKSTYQTPLLPNENLISAVLINGEAGLSFPEVLLYGNQQMFNLSELLKKEVACKLIGIPIQIGPIPPILIGVNKPYAFQVSNVYWSAIPKNNDGIFKIKGSLTNFCDKDLIGINHNTKFEISFLLNHTDDINQINWSIDEKSISIKQIQDPWISILGF